MAKKLSPGAMFAIIACSTVLGIAGTDLVLPAVPSLPAALGGTVQQAQFVLASYALGILVGLLVFGELGARFDPRALLIWSLGLFVLVSCAAAMAPSIEWLIALRFAQGALGSGPAVFAPGFINGLYSREHAPAAIGRLGSIESLAPALAPIAGVYLLSVGGWKFSFWLLSCLGVIATLLVGFYRTSLPARSQLPAQHQTYWTIVRNKAFLRYALSHAFCLGSILVFVFGAPVVITGPLQLQLWHFAILQISGIAMFILSANLSSKLAQRFGTQRVILLGTSVVAIAFCLIVLLAITGNSNFIAIIALWMIINFSFGSRGPIGFYQAIVASEGDHSRGAALVVAGILGTAALGTAAIAPFITIGLWPLALISAGIACVGALSLRLGIHHSTR